MDNVIGALTGLQHAFIELEHWIETHPKEWAADIAAIDKGETVTIDLTAPSFVPPPAFHAPDYHVMLPATDPLHVAQHDFLLY